MINQMSPEQIEELRARIAEVEDDFSRRANILLDDILLTRDQADKNTRAIENLVQMTSESRKDIDLLATRMGELAQSVSELRQNQQLLTFTISQVSESMTLLSQTQRETTDRFIESFTRFQDQATADRALMLENQAEIRRIWEYLLSTRPNGRGDG